MIGDIGAEVYQSWSEERRRDEIGKLVQGYRAGLPVVILCTMADSIAGSQEMAREYLASFMTYKERQKAVKSTGKNGELRATVSSFLL
ncbi:MAG: hypothetical protein ED859_01235 [Desulfuromonadales bacterium]|nr:MAG: hypothetical protein ED859_01235 [Desulfuromonadales bacterium]